MRNTLLCAILVFTVTSSLYAFPTAEAASNSSVTKTDHPLPGTEAHAVAVVDGVLYAIGGYDGTTAVNDTYAYCHGFGYV